MDDKDAIITQQRLIIKDQQATVEQQRNKIAELEYNRQKYDLMFSEPIRFLMFIWLKDVWPFKYLYQPGEQ